MDPLFDPLMGLLDVPILMRFAGVVLRGGQSVVTHQGHVMLAKFLLVLAAAESGGSQVIGPMSRRRSVIVVDQPRDAPKNGRIPSFSP